MLDVLNETEPKIDTAGKRALIDAELTNNPNRSDREIARIVGCDHKTVGAARERLGIATPLGNSPPSPTERRHMLIEGCKEFDRHCPPDPADLATAEEAVDNAIAKGIVKLAPDANEDEGSFWSIPHQARIEVSRAENDPATIEIRQEGQHGEDADRIHVSERNVVALARRLLWAAGFKSVGIYVHARGGGCVDLEDGAVADDISSDADKPGYGPVR